MKNFLKENWGKVTIVFIVVFIGISLFYWYEVRPSHIRKECIINARQGRIGGYQNPLAFNEAEFLAKQGVQKVIDEIYFNCLRENGLEK